MGNFYSLEAKLKVLVGQLRGARKEMEVLPEPEMKITNWQRELGEGAYRPSPGDEKFF
jgi:hypothetical protein